MVIQQSSQVPNSLMIQAPNSLMIQAPNSLRSQKRSLCILALKSATWLGLLMVFVMPETIMQDVFSMAMAVALESMAQISFAIKKSRLVNARRMHSRNVILLNMPTTTIAMMKTTLLSAIMMEVTAALGRFLTGLIIAQTVNASFLIPPHHNRDMIT